MKKHFLFSILFAGVVGLSGCNVKNPDDINKDLEKKLVEDKKKNDDLIDTLKKSMEKGGQPGKVKVSGIIVKDSSKTDVRITIVAKGGVGKDGTEAKIGNDYQPVLSGTNEKVDLSKITEQKNLVAVGCDEKAVNEFAKERQLEIQNLLAPTTKDVMIVTAKTIVLCGKLETLKYQYLTVQADELILDSVDFTQIGLIGSSTFNSNKLVLMGSNKITTKGINSSMTLALTPSLEFNALKEISSNDDGKLLIMSAGSDYVAETK